MHRQYGALSGVAIVLIALNHAIHFGFEVAPVEGVGRSLLIVLQALGAFAVPAFLFISGAFLAYSAGQLSFQFVRSSVGRIIWPYAIWSAIFYIVVFVLAGERHSALGYVKNLMVGYPYHFVPLLVFWYVAAPLVVAIGRRHPVALLTAIGAYQALLLAVRYPEMFGQWDVLRAGTVLLKVPVLFTSMSDWAIYFPLGLVLSVHHGAVKPVLVRLRWLALTVTAGIFVAGLLNAFQIVPAPWARFLAPVPLLLLLPTIDRNSIPFVRRLETIGRQSYGIYLVHFVVINVAVVLVAPIVELQPALMWLVFPAFLFLALAGPLFIMDALARVPAARNIYRSLFGFAPPAAAARRPLPGKVAVVAER